MFCHGSIHRGERPHDNTGAGWHITTLTDGPPRGAGLVGSDQQPDQYTRGHTMSVMQLFDLTGKVALITGGTKGLGLQMAEALGEQGAKIFLNARNADEVDTVVAQLNARGIEAAGIACDLGKLEGNPVAALVDAVQERFGTVDILVNNAGTTWGQPAAEHSYAGW